MKKKNITFLIMITVIVIGIGFVVYRKNRLNKHFVILPAQSKEWKVGVKTRNLKFEFLFNREVKTGFTSFPEIQGLMNFENKNFIAVYDSILGASELLILPRNFERYHIPFPDSLNWVLKYLNK